MKIKLLIIRNVRNVKHECIDNILTMHDMTKEL